MDVNYAVGGGRPLRATGLGTWQVLLWQEATISGRGPMQTNWVSLARKTPSANSLGSELTSVGSQSPQRQLEDGTTYHARWPAYGGLNHAMAIYCVSLPTLESKPTSHEYRIFCVDCETENSVSNQQKGWEVDQVEAGLHQTRVADTGDSLANLSEGSV